MAERDPTNPIVVIANMVRAVPEDGYTAAQEAAVDTLVFLEERCEDLDADPGPTAHLAILDLAAALIAFGAVRNVEELVAWLREEAPARARELAVAVSKASLADAPVCSCLSTPAAASWH